MPFRLGLRSWIAPGISRYVEERRQALDGFLRECFSFRGTCRLFWRTLRSDLLRHPLNFILAIPKLLFHRIAGVMEKFGWYSLARGFHRLSLVLRSGFESAREEQIVGGLIGASDEAEIRGALEGPLSHFMAARPPPPPLARGGGADSRAHFLFLTPAPGPFEKGAKSPARARPERGHPPIFLGRGGGGGVFNIFFPPHPTWGQIATSTALVILLLGVLTAVLSLLSDPLQQALGVHRRQLSRLLTSFEENLLVQAARRPRDLPIGSE